jgi:hypothetical protein
VAGSNPNTSISTNHILHYYYTPTGIFINKKEQTMTGTLYRGYEIVVKPIDHPIISQHKDCDIPQAFTRGRYTIYNIDIYYHGVNVWGVR